MFFGPNAASPPKNTFGLRRCHGLRIDLRHVPFVELDADCRARSTGTRFPGRPRPARRRRRKCWSGSPVGTRLRRPLASYSALTFSNSTPVSLPFSCGEFLRHEEIEDRDVFVHGVFLFPGGRLHLLEARAHDDFHVLAAEPARGAAAIHRGVAAAEHDDALADLVDVAERDARQPVDADMDVLRPLPCGRECRDRGRAARRSRRRSRRNSRRAAPSGCRCACRRRIRRRDRGCSRTSSSITVSGRRNFGICVRIMPPACGSWSNTTHS